MAPSPRRPARVVLGAALLPLGVLTLCWNESRALRAERSLAEGAGLVREAPADRIDPALEGRLVHVAGALRVAAALADPEFAVQVPGAVLLRRTVQTFQWREEQNGRASATTYTYRPVWSDQPIDSSRFRQQGAAHNPPPRFAALSLVAPDATLGAYLLPETLLRMLPGGRPVTPPAGLDGTRVEGAALYVGQNPAAPQVGDQRIGWEAVVAAEASVVAQQRGAGLGAYRTRAGDGIALIRPGLVPAGEMIAQEQDGSAAATWAMRFGGAAMLFLGVWLAAGRGAVRAGVLAGLAAPVVIAVAWAAVRAVS